jgi:hypothetical protein
VAGYKVTPCIKWPSRQKKEKNKQTNMAPENRNVCYVLNMGVYKKETYSTPI